MKSLVKKILRKFIAMHLVLKVAIIMIFSGNNLIANTVVLKEKTKNNNFIFQSAR